jgi:hypothetical protein
VAKKIEAKLRGNKPKEIKRRKLLPLDAAH